MKNIRFYKKKCIFGMLPILYLTLSMTSANAMSTPALPNVSAAHNHHLVVLIHGLLRGSRSMTSLAWYLKQQDYQVYFYDYPSRKNTIREHGVSLHQSIEKLLAEHPDTTIDFVTHSMGGIIARDALAKLSPDQLKQVGCLIMLAPPNQGSSLAKAFTSVLPVVSYFIKPLTELTSDSMSYVHQVPIPKVKIGIIAGRFDAKSPPSETRLAGQIEPVIVNATHTFIMDNQDTKVLVARFLQKGSFIE